MAAYVLSTHALSAVGARLVWGAIVERMHIRYSQLLNYAACATFINLFLVALKLHIAPLVFVAAGLYGLSVGGNAIMGSLLHAEYFGRENVGAIRGVMGPIQTLLLALLPLGVARVRDTSGDYWLPFFVMIGMFAAGSALMLLAAPPKSKEPPPTVSVPLWRQSGAQRGTDGAQTERSL